MTINSRCMLAIGLLFCSSAAHGFEYLPSVFPLMYDANEPINGGWVMPDDMLTPEDTTTVKIGTAASSAVATGTMISPSWMITAGHIGYGGSGWKPGWTSNAQIFHVSNSDGTSTTYRSGTQNVDMLHLSADTALIKLYDIATGQPANVIDFASIIGFDDDELASLRIVRGNHNRYVDPINGGEIAGARGKQKWGYEFYGGTNGVDNVVDHSIYGSAGSTGNDSGDPSLARHGLSWHLLGVKDGVGGGATAPLARNSGSSSLRDEILSYVDDLPGGTISPSPDQYQLTGGNYTLPGAGLSTWIKASVSLTGSVNEAQDVFVGDFFPGTVDNVSHSAGDVDLSGGLFLGPESGESGNYTQTGGELTAYQIYAGFRGAGQFLQTAGVTNVDSAIRVGFESNSSGQLWLIGTGQTETPHLSLGHETGADGVAQLHQSASLTTDSSFIGREGDGEFVQAGGTHDVRRLSIGTYTTGDGVYKISGGNLIVDSLEIGGDGLGAFEQSGGQITARNATSAANASVTLSGGNMMINGLGDFSQTTVAASPGSSITSGSTALVIIDAPTKALIDGGTLSTTSLGQPVHTAGTTLIIDQHTVQISGELGDRVEILQAGSGHGQLLNDGDPIHLLNGTHVDPDAVVDLGSGTLKVTSGRNGVGLPSTIDVANGSFTGAYVTVESTGHLDATGELSVGTLNVFGELSPGNNQTNTLSVYRGIASTTQLLVGGGGRISFDINATDFDRIEAVSTAILSGSEIEIRVPVADITSLATMSAMDLVSVPDSYIQSPPAAIVQDYTVDYSDASYSDFESEGVALAVLHEGDEYGFTGSRETAEGIMALVTLPGDFNADGRVGNADLTILLANWGRTDATWFTGDVDGNGAVGDAENTALLKYWGQSLAGGTAVPEPESFALLLSLGFALVGSRRQF